jgi:fatty acid-binding protein DegV
MSSDPGRIDPEVTEILETVLYKQIAQLLIAGRSVKAISQELKVSNNKVRAVLATDDLKNYLKEQTEHMVSTAANTWRSSMQARIPAALKALDKLIKKGDAEGIKILLRSLGVDKVQEQTQQAQSITVVLPNTEPKDIEVGNGNIQEG